MKTPYFRIFTLTALTLFSRSEFCPDRTRRRNRSIQKGNFAEAVRLLSQASKQPQYKTDGEIWNYLGLAYINHSKTKDGRKALEKAVKLSPQSSVSRANLAYSHLLENKIDKAQSQIQKQFR